MADYQKHELGQALMLAQRHAMGRLAQPEEIANAVAWLCSEKASFITGHDMVVDGGVLVRSNVIDL